MPRYIPLQLPFPEPPPRSRDEAKRDFESGLAAHLGCPVSVTFSRARTRPIGAEFHEGRWMVRLHEFFVDAGADVRDDLARWLRAGRRARAACDRLDAFLSRSLAALPPARPRTVQLDPGGLVHDLSLLARPLFETWFVADFSGRDRPGLTWGQRRRSRARRGLQLGCFVPRSRIVRVHPVLDHADVPAWFVSFVLYHEILHDVLPEDTHHGPAFREREHRHPDYVRAQRWESRHLRRLIRRARNLPTMKSR
ncbi:MAG: hypothetical protein OER88_01025 [Planctomycetota bacterium]|nr:hypothetical protein [Planctomycetota bacterium]